MADAPDQSAPKPYNPHGDTFTGAIMQNLGYITPEQHAATDFYDGLGSMLAKNNPNLKKPFYGHIANGETQRILDEYQTQRGQKDAQDQPLIPAEKAQKYDQLLAGYDGVKLGIAGETPTTAGKQGSNVDCPDGPMNKILAVQKDLREMEKSGKLAEALEGRANPEGMAKVTRETADRLNITDYPAKLEQHTDAGDGRSGMLTIGPIEATQQKLALNDHHRDVDNLLGASTSEKLTAERTNKPTERHLA